MDTSTPPKAETSQEQKKKDLEIQLAELEVQEKRRALKNSTAKKSQILTSPFTLTLMTILGGLLGTAAGAVLQGYWNAKLERQKFELGIIQKVLEKDDHEGIKKALLFYMDIGVITSLNQDSLREILTEEPDRLPTFKITGPEGEEVNYEVNEDGEITFIDGWDSTSLTRVFIPQLTKINTGSRQNLSGNIIFYKPATQDLKAAFQEIEQLGKLHLIKSWDGSFVARTVRTQPTRLSEHALGIAFDINARWNSSKGSITHAGEEGSVLELVPIFKKHGFEWGGNRNSPDPMHFVWKNFKKE